MQNFNSIERVCLTHGGIFKLWLANPSTLPSDVYDREGFLDSFSPTNFVNYVFEKGRAYFGSSLDNAERTGTETQTLDLALAKSDLEKYLELKKVLLNGSIVVFLDNNSIHRVMGTKARPAFLRSSEDTTGGSQQENNELNLNIYWEKPKIITFTVVLLPDNATIMILISDVQGLQVALDGKAALAHIHATADSLEYSSNAYRLLGDEATPNKSHNYGTNPAGTRGFYTASAVWFGVQVFTEAPPATNQITFTDALVKVGFGLRYKIGGIWFYGIITAYSGATATIVGEPASGTITELEFCLPDNIERLPYDLSDKTLTVASSTALTAQSTNGNYKPTTWYDAPAKLVAAYVRCRVKGAGTNPVVNLRLSAFGSDAFGSNITLAADETTYGTGVTSTPANNVLAFGNTIQLRVITENVLAKHMNLYLLIIKNV